MLPRAAAGFRAAIARWIAPKTTVNYAAHFEDEAEFRSAWPDETFARLAEVRHRVDPDGVFPYGPR